MIGFILAGVMTDYKESEKIPGEILTSLQTIWLETSLIHKKNPPAAMSLRKKVVEFTAILQTDFLVRREERTAFQLLDSFSEEFELLYDTLPPPFLVRLKNEQAALRKLLVRIKVIRDTHFSHNVYFVIKSTAAGFVTGLLLLKMEPFAEGIFFLCLYVYMLVSVIILIRDMDDPFEYSDNIEKIDEIDFKILFDYAQNLGNKIAFDD
ncbi:MAG: hypothetical protein ACHQQQ_01785 [Bacteroidota bacterium]